MIKSVQLKNFFSFKNITIHLNPGENILIGINGSGKSNFLRAFRLLKESIAGTGLKKLVFDKWGGFDNICFSGMEENDESECITVEYQFDGQVLKDFGFLLGRDVYYKLTVHKHPGMMNYYLSEQISYHLHQADFICMNFDNGSGYLFTKEGSRDPEFRLSYNNLDPQESVLRQINDPGRLLLQDAIRKIISEITVFDYFDTRPHSKIRKPMLPTSEKRLLPDGSNLPQILNTLKINNRRNFGEILKKLKDVNEHYVSIDFNMIGGNIELMLEEENLGRSVHVSHISDGTLYFLCLLSVFHNPARGKLVCIDEPETALHPDMILNITDAIRDSSDETQFIVATHSENIVNAFEIGNIRVFEKNDKNQSVVEEYAEADFEGWYEEYRIGKMWSITSFGEL